MKGTELSGNVSKGKQSVKSDTDTGREQRDGTKGQSPWVSPAALRFAGGGGAARQDNYDDDDDEDPRRPRRSIDDPFKDEAVPNRGKPPRKQDNSKGRVSKPDCDDMPPLEPSDGLGAQITDDWWGEGIGDLFQETDSQWGEDQVWDLTRDSEDDEGDEGPEQESEGPFLKAFFRMGMSTPRAVRLGVSW